MRVARILWGLLSRPYGWRFEAIERDLGISERTLLRYVKACREELVDGRGRPLLEVVRRGERRLLRLAEPRARAESTAGRTLAFYFALSVFRFLDGAGLEDNPDGVWARFRSGLPRDRRVRLRDLDRKLVALAPVSVDPRRASPHLDCVLRGLVEQHVLRLEVGAAPAAASEGAFAPYTLALVDGALHVIGQDLAAGRVVRLALDDIRGATLTAERFEYPATYQPERHLLDGGGTGSGEATEVAILVRTEHAVRQLRACRLHPSQRFIRQQGGAAVLSLRTRPSDDLTKWILAQGPGVEVIAPRALRDDVRRAHAAAAALYAE